MKINIKYGDRDLILKSYNIKTERDLLFLMEPKNIDEILLLLLDYIDLKINDKVTNPLKLTESEKFFVCYMLRVISVSEELTVKLKCDKCESEYNKNFNIDDFLKNNENCKIFYENPEDYYDDNLDLLDFDKEVDKIEIDFIKSFECKCGNKIYVDFKDLKSLPNIFSESDISSFYKEITSLVKRGNFDLNGIYNDMLPVERKLYIEVTNELRVEDNKTDGLNLSKKF